MTAYTAPSRYVPEGVNRGNEAFIEFVIPTTMANADTISVTYPDGLDTTQIPFAFQVVNKTPTPYTYSQDANIGFTSYNATTGVLIMTATGAVTAGDTVIVRTIGG